jgi:hypothetical protein
MTHEALRICINSKEEGKNKNDFASLNLINITINLEQVIKAG